MSQNKEWIAYVNGEYVPQSQAKVSIFDHGFIWADGVYDTLVAMNGYIFKMDEHLGRLFRSIQSFGLDMPLDKKQCQDIIVKVCEENGAKDQYIKIIVSSGVGPTPVMDRKSCKPTVVVFSRPVFYLVDKEKEGEKGIKTAITSIRRIPAQCLDPKAKNLNYGNFVLAEREARQLGADMAIMCDIHGFVNESPGYNIFIAVSGNLYTPPPENILIGVTRDTIFEICQKENISLFEKRLIPYDLYNADEVFLSCSLGGTAAVAEVDGRVIKDGKPGLLTKRLKKVYDSWVLKGVHGTPFKFK